jgi:hypothetical protein
VFKPMPVSPFSGTGISVFRKVEFFSYVVSQSPDFPLDA